MNRTFVVSVIAVFCLVANACFQHHGTQRATDPWVIRINLDERPNMIALALNEKMYAAYDASLGALYKVWKGDIKFTGPVYDNLHGPQPFSRGESYISYHPRKSPWMIKVDDGFQQIEADYQGYTLDENQVTLKYELYLPNGSRILLEETPDCNFQGELPGFERQFKTSGVPADIEVALHVSFDHLRNEKDLQTNGELIENVFTENEYEWGSSFSSVGILKLNENSSTYIKSTFHPEALKDVAIDKQDENGLVGIETVSEETSVINEDDIAELSSQGKTLIGQSDCAACHMIDKAVIGPSYTMIAQKYESSMTVIEDLAGKIINGGSGVWGERPMSPHPNIGKAEAKAMAAYIVSVVPDSVSEHKPGVVANFYKIGQPLSNLPEVEAGQNPNASVVYPSVDFRSGNPDIGLDTDENFSGFDIDFVMEVSGYLNLLESKTYDLQFVANNGGRLVIDGKTVSEGHFYEGTFVDEFELYLTEGAHKFQINFYHHLFDKYLILGWRENPGEEYQPIPASIFTHNPFEIRPTSPGIKEIVSNKAPGFGASLEKVHPSFDLSPVRPEGFEPRVGDIEFRENGNLVLCTWEGEVFELKNIANGKSEAIKVSKIADGLCEPLGITEVDGEIYVLQRWELTKLVDNDQDGTTDQYICIATLGSSAQFHEWSFGLIYRDGYFYCTTGIAMGRGADGMSIDRGKAIKIGMDGQYSYLAYGLKEPNGIGFGLDGEIFVTDNEGEYVPVSKMVHIPAEGNPFFGNRSVTADNLPEDLEEVSPVIWLPQNEIGNSPSQPIMMHHGPYEGQMIHGEITHGGIKRDFIEKIKGQYQGAVFRFSQGLEVGINRLEWGPDGSLYAAGLGGAQDFGHKGHQFGLQRLTYNGNPAFEMLAIRAKANGLEIEFTKPLRTGDGTAPGDYKIQQWHYIWTHEIESQQKRNLENLAVRSVTLSNDRKKVFLELDGMKRGHVLYVQLQPPFLSEENDQLWSNEGWYTLNEIPDEPETVSTYPYNPKSNLLTPPEINQGWELLFDGKSVQGWQGKQTAGWMIEGENLKGLGQSTLIQTSETYDNFELELEWKVGPESEGGILFNIPEGTDVEKALSISARMQLTDDNSEDAKSIHIHRSGANYDIEKPEFVVSNPANEYNHARLVVRGKEVEHWINGVKVLVYEIGSEAWTAAIQASPYSHFPQYGKAGEGHLALYSGKGNIWFKNIRIRQLSEIP